MNTYPAHTESAAPTFDMLSHLARQREFSERTFGPGSRAKGVVDHIRKELCEIEADPSDLSEWADVVILALDGFWRAGASPQQIIDTIVAKQTKNEARVWPDWRTMPTDKAIEHDRSHDAPASSPVSDAAINIDDDLNALDGPLLELDALLANLHQDVWESASQSLCAYDEAGLEEAKAIQRHVRAMLSADRTAAPEPHHLTGEQIAALRVAADTLIERYAAPIRAILANADQFDAAKALAASGAWQPIETAPRDGTPVLGCVFHEKLLHLYAPTTIYWAAYHPNAEGEKTWRTSLIGGHKMRGVTHWMPIPTVPTEGSDA